MYQLLYLELSAGPASLTPGLFLLRGISRKVHFKVVNCSPRRIVMPDGSVQEDRILDDTSLAFRSRDGVVVITGCAHAGICNTVMYAKKVCGESRVHDIIGGLHLCTAGPQLDGTLAYLKTRTFPPTMPVIAQPFRQKWLWHRLPSWQRPVWD